MFEFFDQIFLINSRGKEDGWMAPGELCFFGGEKEMSWVKNDTGPKFSVPFPPQFFVVLSVTFLRISK